ncbi:MAG: sulfatase-like hydrolase/transferase [Planctomycetota bacterium]|nr:sulfatase-like hydrolase/transferase [Planctomycetota bacterium]
MRRVRNLCPLLLLVACASTSGDVASSKPRPCRGVVLLLADDLGAGELSSAGHPHIATPHLDALARDGLTLTRFNAAAPVCSPTRASVLTGRHPVRTTTFAWGHDLPPAETTLPELLTARGVRTAHFGKWHLGSVRAGLPTSPGGQGYATWAAAPNFFDLDPDLSVNGRVVSHEGEGSEVITARALSFLREVADADTPFFVTIWFGSPHNPHEALPEDLAAQAAAPESARAYCAEIAAVDRCVGRVRAELETLGVADETLLWFTSDNGPRPPKALARTDSTAGLRGIKGTLWEGGLRVPSILRWPAASPPGRTVDAPCGTIDLLPTIAAALDAPAPTEGLDGTSLLPLLRGDANELPPRGLGFWTVPVRGRPQHGDRILAAMARGEAHPEETPPSVDAELLSRESLPGRAAWIRGRYKLHSIPAEGTRRLELYDLAADPGEEEDLADAEPELASELAAELEAWRRSAAADARAHLGGRR